MIFLNEEDLAINKTPVRFGFLRVRNEEATILPFLLSVDKLFDYIICVHSGCTDNTVNIITQFAKSSASTIIIEEYRHRVHPAYTPPKQTEISYKNSLAAYYNFGMDIIKSIPHYKDYYVVAKLDADQIYIPDIFDEYLSAVKDMNYSIAMNGINSGVCFGRFFGIIKSREYNGGTDHLVMGKNNLWKFSCGPYYETDLTPHKYINTLPWKPVWMHFTKFIKYDDVLRPLVKQDLISIRKHTLANMYWNEYVLPFLKEGNSMYKDLICM